MPTGTPAPPAAWGMRFRGRCGRRGRGRACRAALRLLRRQPHHPVDRPQGGVQSQRVVVAVIRQVDQQQPVAEPAGRLDLAEPAHVEGSKAEHHHYPLAGCARWASAVATWAAASSPGHLPRVPAGPAQFLGAHRGGTELADHDSRRHVGGGRIVQRQPRCHAAAQRCDHGIAGAGHIEHPRARVGRLQGGWPRSRMVTPRSLRVTTSACRSAPRAGRRPWR